MEGHGGFNHNEHSLRVVDRLEKRYPRFDGLNLSWEVRESTIKHGGRLRQAELHEEFQPQWSPLLEAQLADAADSLAYTSHDIDDGLRSNFIQLEELRQVRLWADAERQVTERCPGIDPKTLIARSISQLIDWQVGDLIAATHARLEEHGIDSIDRVRAHAPPLVGFSQTMQALTAEMQQFLKQGLYLHHRVLKMAQKAKRFLRLIFLEYVRSPQQLPPAYLRRAESESVHRAICDYLAGMTDRFCQEEYQRLFHTFERL
jgi:dGTPase